MSGPLPNPQSRRRNPPTAATDVLPARRTGRAPKLPDRFELGDAGMAFWRRAWKLPQAAKWEHHVDAVARRAELEDLAAARDMLQHLDLEDVLLAPDDDELRQRLRNLEWMLDKLQRLATGTVGLMKQMDALDDRLGLNPKALAQLRWTIEEPAKKKPTKKAAAAAAAAEVAQLDAYRDRIGG